MKTYFTIFFSFMYLFCLAQKQDYIWLGGYQKTDTGKAKGFTINFNNDFIPFIDTTYLGIGIIGNNASLCDKEGNFFFTLMVVQY